MYKDNKFSNAIVKLLVFLMIFIFGYLFIVSMFSTVYVSELENIYYISDSFIKNLFIIILFTSILFIFKDKINNIVSGNETKMVIFNTIVISVILLFFVLSSRLYPLYDQAKVLNVVKHMFVYDYSDFLPGGYIDKYDVQKGITIYFYLISKLLGKISITAIQLLNALYIVISYIFIYKFSALLFGKKKAAFIHFAMCLYAPLWLYSSFVYGTIPSFLFGIISLYLFIKIKKHDYDSEKRKYTDIILLGLSLSISIFFKTNSVIILVALVLLCVLFLITDKKKVTYLLTLISLIAFYYFSSKIQNSYISNMTKMDMGGIPRTAHIAMALMENSDRGPGWYNGYNEEVYKENGYNKEKANEESIESIKESLNGFKSNPANFVSFLSRKIVTQWNETTYESLFIQYGRDSLNKMPSWLSNLTNPTSTLNKAVRSLFDIMQLLIIFGALSYFICMFKKITINELIPSVVIIGGFFFHILWEAKSQYIIVYFVLLIPYSVVGIIKLIEKINKIKVSESLKSKKCIIKTCILAFIFLFVAVVPSESIFGKIMKPAWKTEQYKEVTDPATNKYETAGTLDKEYAAALTMPKLHRKKGNYIITLSENENLVLCPVSDSKEDTKVKFVEKVKGDINQSVILFTENDDEYSIRFQASQKVLDATNGTVDENNSLQQWDYNGDNGQKFKLELIENEKYAISCGDFFVGVNSEYEPVFVNKDDARLVYVYIKEYQ